MNTPRKDDPSMNIKFVKAVEKYPCLYNYKLPEYSRRDVTDKAWMNVAKEMNYTGNYYCYYYPDVINYLVLYFVCVCFLSFTRVHFVALGLSSWHANK
jgi:hypothetical protein